MIVTRFHQLPTETASVNRITCNVMHVFIYCRGIFVVYVIAIRTSSPNRHIW